MKIYLASFLQPENFGPGRVIGITTGSKLKHVDVKVNFAQIPPRAEVIETYNRRKLFDQKEASEYFTNGYTKQLEEFVKKVEEEASRRGVSCVEVLPFKDGDTLASWERAEFSNYRKILAPFLVKLGYEVNLK